MDIWPGPLKVSKLEQICINTYLLILSCLNDFSVILLKILYFITNIKKNKLQLCFYSYHFYS